LSAQFGTSQRWEQQAGKNRDDSDDHQQLYQSKCPLGFRMPSAVRHRYFQNTLHNFGFRDDFTGFFQKRARFSTNIFAFSLLVTIKLNFEGLSAKVPP
jgi:hypothetical protein